LKLLINKVKFDMKKLSFVFLISAAFAANTQAQEKALVNTSKSPYAKLHGADMGSVTWTDGFWGERFKVARESMVPQLWKVYTSADISHAYRNFEIAAGLAEGSHSGPSFHDGDFYKTLEAVSSLYASTKDKKLEEMMDKAIETIAKSQREDGYIYTMAMIEQRKTGEVNQFQDRLSFEAYNIGHLMTAACVHYRATGKKNLMNVAIKATDYLYNFYKQSNPTLARNAICPSHYMGVVEMYRTLGDKRYLELASHLIDIKGEIEDGTDDNQDRIPFRKQEKVMGHAVRATYLYAGVADVYAETGDKTLMSQLDKMWTDLTQYKMYITGGCGSLYDGTSPDGTSYDPKDVQKIHQAFGRDYQLPNHTAHNETCANIGNVMWNWRMLQLTGEAKYADIVELALYNSVLSGISLDGKRFLYTNPLSYSENLPFQQRWSKERVEYIKLSNCCPPNTVRTIAEVSNYAYSLSDKGIYVNIYGGNNFSSKLKDGSQFKLVQQTAYPWKGDINFRLEQSTSKQPYSLFLRIPEWAESAEILVNGKAFTGSVKSGQFAEINRKWKKGDKVELKLPMNAQLMEANPLVEESRNQVAVKRGPVVYCLEVADLPADRKLADIVIPASINLQPKATTFAGANITALEGNALLINDNNWDKKLYKKVSDKQQEVKISLVPYYSWGNRKFGDMSVWLPLTR
jgi:DUF1680 family protein